MHPYLITLLGLLIIACEWRAPSVLLFRVGFFLLILALILEGARGGHPIFLALCQFVLLAGTGSFTLRILRRFSRTI